MSTIACTSRPAATDDCALLLVGHGSATRPRAGASLRAHAEAIAGSGRFAEVAAAFLFGSPSLEDALTRLRSSRVAVVPFLFCSGHYSRVVIPERLARGKLQVRDDRRAVIYGQPLGEHPHLPGLLRARLTHWFTHGGVQESECRLVLVVHGSPSHPGALGTAQKIAAQLRRECCLRSVEVASLEDPRHLQQALTRDGDTLVAGLFAGEGRHGGGDLPRAIAAAEQRRPRGRLDSLGALGTDPGIADLLSEQATALLAGGAYSVATFR